MSGIQESSDETASLISPGITPVQAPVPPQFADEPISQEPPPHNLSSAPLLHESIVDDASMSKASDRNTWRNKFFLSQQTRKIFLRHHR